MEKNNERIKDYKRNFLKRIMLGEVKSEDWIEILPNKQALHALGDDFNF